MLPRRSPQPALGLGGEVAAREQPAFLPSHLRAEWEAVCQGQHNFLLVGPGSITKEMLVAMTPHFHAPLQQYSPKAGLPVPTPGEGTLVLLEVDKLDRKQQKQLLEWLDGFESRSRVQVVSTTSKPLFALVKAGKFLQNLYYKLNIVRMDLPRAAGTRQKAPSTLD